MFLSRSYGHWFREAGQHREFAALQEARSDERGRCGARRLSRLDGRTDAGHLGSTQLAGGKDSTVCSAKISDGGIALDRGEGRVKETAKRPGGRAVWKSGLMFLPEHCAECSNWNICASDHDRTL